MVRNIIFDFDGVILDSMPIRELGFREIFSRYSDLQVKKLLEYHESNGGLSRYIKIAYFYEQILYKEIKKEKIDALAKTFSDIMKEKLVDKSFLIQQTVEFLEKYHEEYNLHIASGSDQVELRYLCQKLDVAKYFDSIHGSPIHKNDLVKTILDKNAYIKEETILIGDSINDYIASDINGIGFYGYNNTSLKDVSKIYLDDYKSLEKKKER